MGRSKKKTNQEKEINTLEKVLDERDKEIEKLKEDHEKRENQHSMELEERENQHSKELEEIKRELEKTEDENRSLLVQNKILREEKFPKGKDAGASGSPHTDKLEGPKFSAEVTPFGEVDDADRSKFQSSFADNGELCTSTEYQAATKETSRPTIPAPVSIKKMNEAQTLESLCQKLPNLSLPTNFRLTKAVPFKDFMQMKFVNPYHFAYLIVSLLQLLKQVHFEGILIPNFSVENVILLNIGGSLALKISDPNRQATFMPQDDLKPMLERCQSDLICIVEVCSDITKDINRVKKGDVLDILFYCFEKFKMNDIYSQCSAFLEYFILVSIKTNEFPLIKEYIKNPNFTIPYEGRNLHLFKAYSCMQCILKNFSQEVQVNEMLYLRQNAYLVFDTRDWTLNEGMKKLVKACTIGDSFVYSGSVNHFFRFCKNIPSHLVERRNKNAEFKKELSKIKIHNEIDFIKYIELALPKVPFHVLSAIYMHIFSKS